MKIIERALSSVRVLYQKHLDGFICSISFKYLSTRALLLYTPSPLPPIMTFPVDEKNGDKHDVLSEAQSFDTEDKNSDGRTRLNRQLKNRHIAMIRYMFPLLNRP